MFCTKSVGYVGRNSSANDSKKKNKKLSPLWDAHKFNIFFSISLDYLNAASNSSAPEKNGLADFKNQ
jgi:hypothetical protein